MHTRVLDAVVARGRAQRRVRGFLGTGGILARRVVGRRRCLRHRMSHLRGLRGEVVAAAAFTARQGRQGSAGEYGLRGRPERSAEEGV